MQKIDAHQHFWNYNQVRDSWITEDMAKIRRDFLPSDLAPVLKANKVDGCIAVQADPSLTETAWLLELAAENEMIKGVVGWVDLKGPGLEKTLAQFKPYAALKGFRHLLQGEADLAAFLSDGLFEKGLRTILSKGYSYDLLVYHHQLEAIEPLVARLSAELQTSTFILDHLGKPDLRSGEIKNWQRQIGRLAKNENVYCKISGLVTEADWHHWQGKDLRPALDTVLEAFGPQRLLFGSDWPVCLVATSYAEWLEVLMDYLSPCSAEQKAAIFGGNAARCYGI